MYYWKCMVQLTYMIQSTTEPCIITRMNCIVFVFCNAGLGCVCVPAEEPYKLQNSPVRLQDCNRYIVLYVVDIL